MEKTLITRPALGQVASLGQLYNSHTDNFCSTLLFSKIPDDAITRTDNPFSDIHLMHREDYSEKFTKWHINGELQVSILAGLCDLKGSGCYLVDNKTSARSVRSSLLYNIQTKDEQVNIYHKGLKDAFVADAIMNGQATHVVVGISWGAHIVLSCEYQNKDNRNVEEVEGSLSAQICALKGFQSTAGQDMNKGVKGFFVQNPVTTETRPISRAERTGQNVGFDVHIFGDILPEEALPTTLEAALNLMEQTPKLVNSYNEGKGKPLIYHLYPLQLLKEYLGISFTADCKVKFLEEASLLRVVHLFEQTSHIEQQINDMFEDLTDHQFCIPQDDFAEISDMKKEVTIEEIKLKSQLATTLYLVRSGKDEESAIEHLIEKYQCGEFFKEKIQILLTKLKCLSEKVEFAKTLLQHGVKYIGVGASLNNEILQDYGIHSYVLYFKEEKIWNASRQLFLQEVKKNRDCRYYAVDCDIHPNLWPKTGTSIKVFLNGEILVENLVSHLQKPGASPLATRTIGVQTQTDTSLQELLVKCPDKEINILLLGEIGVEKFTWINAFANFIIFYGHQDGKRSELWDQLPKMFIAGEEDVIKTTAFSTNKNKDHTRSQSCRVYLFQIGSTTLRIIDTPGIGDVRGPNYDESNFDNIFNTISQVEKLSGICIILKQNNVQPTVKLQYCIMEILAHLHQDALCNVIFCFIDSQGALQCPENTLLGLKQIFKQYQDVRIPINNDSVYYYDSRACSYSATVKRPATISVDIWDRSMEETKRMIQHISSLKPFLVQGILNVSHARSLIERLTTRRAEVDQLVDKKKRALQDRQKNAEATLPKSFREKLLAIKQTEFQKSFNEIAEIDKALPKVAAFLKRNAIISCNDIILQYMKYLIANEKTGGDTNKLLNALIKDQKTYEQRIHIMAQMVKKGNETRVVDLADIQEQVKHLL